jgi:predicted dehydrogenase
MRLVFAVITLAFLCTSCMNKEKTSTVTKAPISIITLDPGHFHAALVQKSMYPDVDSNVYVYGAEGSDLDLHLQRIKNYNSRAEAPTHWNEIVYTGNDYLEKMISEKKGNLVVISGNNKNKADYISKSLAAGLHVFADKPMIIQQADFEKLKAAFDIAKKQNVQLYDIMTERYEVTNALQRIFSMNKKIFGELEKGTAENPAITKESVHHFYKFVSGNVLVRPQWFMDVKQQGEGLVDVMTHLVDLVQWECFPDQIIDTNQIQIHRSLRWPTKMSLNQFNTITKSNGFPDYLKSSLASDTVLNVYSNGEIIFKINDVYAKTSVIWNYQAPEGTGDTHYSIMKGSTSHLEIRQGKEENYKPTLYILPQSNIDSNYINEINAQLKSLDQQWPGLTAENLITRIRINIPANVQVGHEAHFAQVMEKYLGYLKEKNMPVWEVPNMLAKYYTTTKGLSVAAER